MALHDEHRNATHRTLFTRLHVDDPIAIARCDLVPGTSVLGTVIGTDLIKAGHKFALEPIPVGATVRKGARVIGVATHAIAPGDWVHTHNLRDPDGLPTGTTLQSLPDEVSHHGVADNSLVFQGYKRADGRVGTRNYLAVCIAGNCAATAARRIAEWFTPERLKPYPNIDGVIPLTHEFGCGMEMTGEPMDMLRRTLAASVRHPNVAGAIVVALGCERNNVYGFMEQEKLESGPLFKAFVLQEVGGTLAAIDQGIAALQEMLPLANAIRREPVPLSHLTVGMLHHGLDGYAALTTSPALAVATDLLIAAGGTVVTADSPAMLRMAAEVQQRAATSLLQQKLATRLQWWEQYHGGRNTRLKPGRLPQGKPHGISTSHEQSALALASIGAKRFNAVLAYGEKIDQPGWVLMDSPSYEAVAATGVMACGATLISMTTGTGSTFGAALTPTIKISTSSALHQRWNDDIDIDAGVMLKADITAAEMGARIFKQWITTASGVQTCSEELGAGAEEFAPWPVGVLA